MIKLLYILFTCPICIQNGIQPASYSVLIEAANILGHEGPYTVTLSMVDLEEEGLWSTYISLPFRRRFKTTVLANGCEPIISDPIDIGKCMV